MHVSDQKKPGQADEEELFRSAFQASEKLESAQRESEFRRRQEIIEDAFKPLRAKLADSYEQNPLPADPKEMVSLIQQLAEMDIEQMSEADTSPVVQYMLDIHARMVASGYDPDLFEEKLLGLLGIPAESWWPSGLGAGSYTMRVVSKASGQPKGGPFDV